MVHSNRFFLGGQFFSADSAGVILEWSSLSEKGKKNDGMFV